MNRIQLLGVMVDPVTLRTAIQRIETWFCEDYSCRYVVTPNLDHAVLLRDNPDFRRIYAEADLVIPDGAPLIWASRLTGSKVIERVAGSDLVPGLLAGSTRTGELKVYLLGAAPGVAERAALTIHASYPSVKVVGSFSPPLGFETRASDNETIVTKINEAAPDLLVIGLGAPKQELWIHRHTTQLKCKVAICAGATIDFLAGHRRRAPRWMQMSGTEWLYRALSEPRRLIPRYAKDFYYLPSLLIQDWRAAKRQ